MLPKQHLFYGAIFALALFLIFPEIGLIGGLLIFFSTVLIDFDHYIYYVIKKKDLSLKNAYNSYLLMWKKFFSIPKHKKDYRILFDQNGRLTLVPISTKDADWKLCRIENKTIVKGNCFLSQ